MPTKHLLSKGRKQDKRNEGIFRNGPENSQAIEQKQVWAQTIQKIRVNFWKISEDWHCLEKASWKRRLPQSPKVWTSFHVPQIREHTLVTGFREKMGWSRTGGTCGILPSISTTTTTTLIQTIITSHLDNYKSPPDVLPASTLAPLEFILHMEVRLRVNHIIHLTCGFTLLLS